MEAFFGKCDIVWVMVHRYGREDEPSPGPCIQLVAQTISDTVHMTLSRMFDDRTKSNINYRCMPICLLQNVPRSVAWEVVNKARSTKQGRQSKIAWPPSPVSSLASRCRWLIAMLQRNICCAPVQTLAWLHHQIMHFIKKLISVMDGRRYRYTMPSGLSVTCPPILFSLSVAYFELSFFASIGIRSESFVIATRPRRDCTR